MRGKIDVVLFAALLALFFLPSALKIGKFLLSAVLTPRRYQVVDRTDGGRTVPLRKGEARRVARKLNGGDGELRLLFRKGEDPRYVCRRV